MSPTEDDLKSFAQMIEPDDWPRLLLEIGVDPGKGSSIIRAELPCRFGCRAPAVAIVHYPAGCICWPDPVQALCAGHLAKGLQNNEGRVVVMLGVLEHMQGGRKR